MFNVFFESFIMVHSIILYVSTCLIFSAIVNKS